MLQVMVVDSQSERPGFITALEPEISFVLVDSSSDALRMLEHQRFSLVIAGQLGSDRRIIQFLHAIRMSHPDIIRVLMTQSRRGQLIVDAIREGDVHHMICPNWDPAAIRQQLMQGLERHRLGLENLQLQREVHSRHAQLESTRHELERVQGDLTRRLEEYARELSEMNARLQRATREAITDGLTGLYNYRHFLRELLQELKRADRSRRPVSLILMDLDRFKQFNDDFGHRAGDEALNLVAKVLQANMRAHDTVARYGGEEFLVLLPDTTREAAEKVEAKLRSRLLDSTGAHLSRAISASFGISTFPEEARDPHLLLELADQAMYREKRQKREKDSLSTCSGAQFTTY